MSTAVSTGASIHHLAGVARPHPRGAALPESADDKLDRALEMLTDVRVDIGRIAERQTALADQSASTTRDVEQLADRHRQDIRALWVAVDELRARPVALTGRALLAAAGGVVALAVGVVQILTHVTIR